ncbi:MogA/MoaB family molybdenum cofactor biosynthesis protein [Alicyclobacillus tolerans]|uniref:MogA/MoaB family molybdenum cofactor biosynthesis protein n=1 Tax=Alicyclobacillus tolerans TaxID=90970 RepID=UPI001F2937A9|nr:MogA/MoaB family molybdenum cofactor biosynthesis protein [Alicyclobacillus tolerans]MCF8566407.1 MogA/MoaB family molybdenum cofactor biosynthesis protein [Alicyclobacillus tolerans]
MPGGKQAAVVTISDTLSQGKREDGSGDALEALLKEAGFQIAAREVVPDERELIAALLLKLCEPGQSRLVVTTGGTGIGPRDVTPEATLDVVQRTLPGMAEAMRMESLKHTPFAMTSRQVVGVCNTSLVVNLPGSIKAVKECMGVITPVLNHVLDVVSGHTAHKE